MGRLLFSVFWTIGTIAGCVALLPEIIGRSAPDVGYILFLMPPLGAFFIWDSWRRHKRYSSLHREIASDGSFLWVWVELDGSTYRSVNDPRPGWETSDADCADGGGGD